MLGHIQGAANNRKLRLFAVASCRLIWPWLTDERSRHAVETAERFADDRATAQEISAAFAGANDAFLLIREMSEEGWFGWPARAASAATLAAWDPARWGGHPWMAADIGVGLISNAYAIPLDPNAVRYPPIEFITYANLLRDIIPNPFRRVPVVQQDWVAWKEARVQMLAQDTYDERTLPAGTLDAGRLAVLADALEDSGCTDPDLLGHLRGPGPHYRGCWAIDLLLGKGA
jgi:hypothetical protein